MPNAIDETGHTFGNLMVLRRSGSNRRGEALWLCRCMCGRTTIIRGVQLRSGMAKSCGCSHYLSKGKAAFNVVLRDYKRQAIKRGISWELSNDEFTKIIQSTCFYCGEQPSNGSLAKIGNRLNGRYIYNGIDRKDNREGYTRENVVPCCASCNRMKGVMSSEEFLARIDKISRNHPNIRCSSKLVGMNYAV